MPGKDSEPVKRKAGRPKKSEIAANTKGKRKALGRPPGQTAAFEEYRARLLASPKSRRVLDSILSAALNDDHRNQAAAWKIVADRLLPLSYFEKDKASGGRSAVNITITGVGGDITTVGETIENDLDG